MANLVIDVAERAFFTYLEAFLGMLLAGSVLDISTLKAAAVAAIPAGLAVIKGAISGFLGPRSGASALPAAKPVPAVASVSDPGDL